MQILKNVPLEKYASFRTGGNADLLVFPANVCELVKALNEYGEDNVYGCLSNTLVGDGGVRGAVVLTTAVRGMERDGNAVTACCGDTLSALANFALANSLTGAEFCYGIPGTVGGGVFMNAGAYGGEMKDIVKKVTLFSRESGVFELSASEMEFGYRKSVLQKIKATVLKVQFALAEGEKETIRGTMDDLMRRRKEKQPLEFPSCGSVFKRPEGFFAGALIEQCGLKGKRIGGAEVSRKHAGFIINAGGANSADMRALTELVKAEVKEKTGVELCEEIRFIGEP